MFRANAASQTSHCSSSLWLPCKKWWWTQVPEEKCVPLSLLASLYSDVLHKLRHLRFFFCPEEPLWLPSKYWKNKKYCYFPIIQCDTCSSVNTGPELGTCHRALCCLLWIHFRTFHQHRDTLNDFLFAKHSSASNKDVRVPPGSNHFANRLTAGA